LASRSRVVFCEALSGTQAAKVKSQIITYREITGNHSRPESDFLALYWYLPPTNKFCILKSEVTG